MTIAEFNAGGGSVISREGSSTIVAVVPPTEADVFLRFGFSLGEICGDVGVLASTINSGVEASDAVFDDAVL